jgi:hypothetical protein
MKIQIKGWMYELDQNIETGELKVLDVKKSGIAKKVLEYAKAEISAVVSSVPLPKLEARKASCDSCESCRKAGDAEWYCQSCGCPEWERSRLQVKWEMPGATCPLGKWTGNI